MRCDCDGVSHKEGWNLESGLMAIFHDGPVIRSLRAEEAPLLEDFLYEAVYVPEDFTG